jgi:hypothetical protein
VGFSRSAKGRLTVLDSSRFPTGSLFDRIGRAVCAAGGLPRKELYEAWETARRIRRRVRGGRVIDLAAGHGLLGQVMLLLDDTSPSVLLVDTAIAPSASRVHEALVERWPRLAGRVTFLAAPLESVGIRSGDVVVSVHACGALSDVVLDRAAAARARVAVLPCCHDASVSDTGALTGWLDDGLAIDVVRARRLADQGYQVWTRRIPASITPRNRLLIGSPLESPVAS